MRTDERWRSLETGEGGAERAVAFLDGSVEAVVRRQLPGDLPHSLGGIELRRVTRKSVQLELVAILSEPLLPGVVEVVTGPAIDDQEDFPGRVLPDELLKKLVKGVPVEDFGESVGEVRVFEGYRPEDVCSLPLPEGVDPWLYTDPRPRLMERAVEPEAGFVFKDDEAPTRGSFFLIAGNRS